MKKLLIIGGTGLAAVALAVGLAGSPAGASGGWAISSLDEVPAPRADEPVAVGFTILQHGRSPANVDPGSAAVIVRGEDGPTRFEARQEGPVGHYVADVEFPAAGSYTWAVDQGAFGEFDLGSISVAPGAGSPSGASSPVEVPPPPSDPVVLRVLLPLVGLAGLGLLAYDLRLHGAARRGMATG